MNDKEIRSFHSHNKRTKETIFLIVTCGLIVGLIAFVFLRRSISVAEGVALPILFLAVLSLSRSIQYATLRAELSSRTCDIYHNDQRLARIQIGGLKLSYHGRGGLKIKLAPDMSIASRLRLASLFFHFIGPCVRYAVLPNALFPNIGQLAEAFAKKTGP
jgi:hypothetical protein